MAELKDVEKILTLQQSTKQPEKEEEHGDWSKIMGKEVLRSESSPHQIEAKKNSPILVTWEAIKLNIPRA